MVGGPKGGNAAVLLGWISHMATVHLQGALGIWKPPLQGMCETMPWVPDGGHVIRKEFAWCPGPERHHVITLQLLRVGSGQYGLLGRAEGQHSGELGLGPDLLFDLRKPHLPVTPVSPLLMRLMKPLLKVFQYMSTIQRSQVLLIPYPRCLLPSSS